MCVRRSKVRATPWRTSPHVIGEPSCHVRPGRRVNAHVRAPSLGVPASVARSPWMSRWWAPVPYAVRPRAKVRWAKNASGPTYISCGSHVATVPATSTCREPPRWASPFDTDGAPPSVACVLPDSAEPVHAAAAAARRAALHPATTDLVSPRTTPRPPPGTARSALGLRRRTRTGRGAGALAGVEDDLADADRLGRDLDALVLAAELEALLEAQLARRDDLLEVVRGGGAHVGELLLLGNVDVHVVGAGVLADDHALVDLCRRVDEERAALLEVDHGVGGDDALAVGDQGAARTGRDGAEPRLVVLEDVVGDAGATGLGEELGAEADEATAGHEELHADPAGPVVGHLLHAALASGHDLRDGAEELLRGVDREALDGLVDLAVDLARDDLRVADGQLVALAAHLLDEDGERELTTALDLPGVRTLRVEDAQRHVADELLVEAVLDHAGRDLRAADLADHRARVGADRHRDGRLVDGDERQRDRVLGVGERLADRDLGDARDGDDVARAGLLGGLALEGLGHEQLGDLHALLGAVVAAPHDLLALLDRAVEDTEQGEAAEEVGGVEVGDVRLQGRLVVVRRRGDRLEDRLEEGLEVLALRQATVVGALERRAAGLGRGVDDREVDLLLRRVEVEEELVGLVDDLGDARVRTVDLVDAQDDRHLRGERLAQHEAGLGQRALGRVDEQDDTVDHRQAALALTTEVGVAGGVDDVDRDAVGQAAVLGGLARVVHRGVLREDRDALLALEVTGVHRALVDVLVLAERAGLPEHLVDEGGLAVVDVGDDGDVADVRAGLHGHEGQSLRVSRVVRTTASWVVRVWFRRRFGRPDRTQAGAAAARAARRWAGRRGATRRHGGRPGRASAARRGPRGARACPRRPRRTTPASRTDRPAATWSPASDRARARRGARGRRAPRAARGAGPTAGTRPRRPCRRAAPSRRRAPTAPCGGPTAVGSVAPGRRRRRPRRRGVPGAGRGLGCSWRHRWCHSTRSRTTGRARWGVYW